MHTVSTMVFVRERKQPGHDMFIVSAPDSAILFGYVVMMMMVNVTLRDPTSKDIHPHRNAPITSLSCCVHDDRVFLGGSDGTVRVRDDGGGGDA